MRKAKTFLKAQYRDKQTQEEICKATGIASMLEQ